jgi:hypothetical protein
MESCRDVSFTKVNSIARRLSRVDENRRYILGELGAVAHSLATDAIRDLWTLNIRMQDAVTHQKEELAKAADGTEAKPDGSRCSALLKSRHWSQSLAALLCVAALLF